jgi:hypothetical protein
VPDYMSYFDENIATLVSTSIIIYPVTNDISCSIHTVIKTKWDNNPFCGLDNGTGETLASPIQIGDAETPMVSRLTR